MIYHHSMNLGQQSVEHSAGASAGDAVLAPILGARRDRATTASSTRDLLITILGEMVRPGGGAVWTQTLLDTLALFDVESKTGRQAIARLGEQGWLETERIGRRTRWHLTDSASHLLESGAERIYSFGRHAAEWDEHWLLLLVSVPDTQRKLRYRLGVGLGWAGFGAIGQGNWLSPWSGREREAVTLLEELNLTDATIFRASVGAVGDGTQLAARAWDLDEIRSAYDRFITETHERRDSPETAGEDAASGALAAADVIELVHRWRRFPLADPDLPTSLLPADWPKEEAVELFATLHESLGPSAAGWWQELETKYGS